MNEELIPGQGIVSSELPNNTNVVTPSIWKYLFGLSFGEARPRISPWDYELAGQLLMFLIGVMVISSFIVPMVLIHFLLGVITGLISMIYGSTLFGKNIRKLSRSRAQDIDLDYDNLSFFAPGLKRDLENKEGVIGDNKYGPDPRKLSPQFSAKAYVGASLWLTIGSILGVLFAFIGFALSGLYVVGHLGNGLLLNIFLGT